MSKRSPHSQAVTFAVQPNTPQALEGHQFWGQYDYADPVNVGSSPGARNLPNEAGNALAAPAFANLEVGDVATTTDALFANRGMYMCVDPGTVGASDAVWRRIDNAGLAVQTIRDAHVIVVGQDGFLSALLPQSPDVLGVTCDYLDAGDGVQIAAALAAALASANEIDIRLRPMGIVRPVGAAPLDVPASCRLIGAGQECTSINGPDDGATQTTITLGAFATLEEMSVTSPAPKANIVGAPGGVVVGDTQSEIHRCHLSLFVSTLFDRVEMFVVLFTTSEGKVFQSLFTLGDGQTQPTPSATHGVVFGTGGFLETAIDGLVESSWFQGGNVGVSYRNTTGGRVTDCDFVEMKSPNLGVLRWDTNFVVAATAVRMPRFNQCRIVVDSEDVSGLDKYGIWMRGAANAVNFKLPEVSDVTVEFARTVTPDTTIKRVGCYLAAARGRLDSGSIRGVHVLGHDAGIWINASPNAGEGGGVVVSDIRIDACTARGTVGTASGAFAAPAAPAGCILQATGGDGTGTMDRVGVVNCSFGDTKTGAYGIDITDAFVLDSIVVANAVKPAAVGGGTNYQDLGTGSEFAHNIG